MKFVDQNKSSNTKCLCCMRAVFSCIAWKMDSEASNSNLQRTQDDDDQRPLFGDVDLGFEGMDA